jgi:hypothetical protein
VRNQGDIASRREDAPADVGGLPRRIYEPTTLGRRVVEASSRVARLLPELAR